MGRDEGLVVKEEGWLMVGWVMVLVGGLVLVVVVLLYSFRKSNRASFTP